jgi:hypothetical protein
MPQSHFPLWALITQLAGAPVVFIFLGLLLRRLRCIHPTTWESLGRPSLLAWAYPKPVITLLAWAYPKPVITLPERLEAFFRLVIFPFRAQSFQLSDPVAAILLWLLRVMIVLGMLLSAWSWWANP